MKSAHNLRKNWEDSFTRKSDDGIEADIRHVANFISSIGPPYRRDHYDWTAIRCVVLREGRRRGLDVSSIAP